MENEAEACWKKWQKLVETDRGGGKFSKTGIGQRLDRGRFDKKPGELG